MVISNVKLVHRCPVDLTSLLTVPRAVRDDLRVDLTTGTVMAEVARGMFSTKTSKVVVANALVDRGTMDNSGAETLLTMVSWRTKPLMFIAREDAITPRRLPDVSDAGVVKEYGDRKMVPEEPELEIMCFALPTCFIKGATSDSYMLIDT